MKEKEEGSSSAIMDGMITGIRFGLASREEISTSSNSDCPITHPSQLSNPFLGLPLESGKCESCGTAEIGECEGHFGYIELPTPIYHPSHVSELKKMLSLLCLKCLKVKNKKNQAKNVGVAERVLSSCCEEASQVSISEEKTTDGACYLLLKIPSRSHPPNGFWHFLQRYGFRYGDDHSRPLLPSEVLQIVKRIPADSRRKLSGKGYFPQDGYILQYLPVPPNCLSVPDVSDGSSVMSSDHSIAVLKKVLKQADVIKSSRSGTQNFESTEVEAHELQVAVAQYLEVRGTAKASRDVDGRFGIKKEGNSQTKVWLEKMRTLFIRKGSGFSSRSIITGDPYKGVGEIGLPFEIAQRITFEENVSQHNMMYLQKLVDQKLCLAYKDGSSTYSLREGSKGHTFLRPGQVVHRRIMDGDTVFINRPPTTHKHSLQALSVYIHDDHTVKINPLICAPLSADFDGDAIHLFYPQSLAAKAEVLELFSVEKQLLSSHSGNLNLQLATDSVLSLKLMFKNYFFGRKAAQQLAMFVSGLLPIPSLLKPQNSDSLWTVLQVLQTALPGKFDCCGERYNIWQSQILEVDYNRDLMQSIINDVVTSIFFGKGPIEVLKFFDFLQPMLMENLFIEGFSVGLEDFFIPKEIFQNCQARIQELSPLLYRMRVTHNELIALQLEKQIRNMKVPIANYILKSSAMGYLIDSKSESATSKVVQQVGFLGLQISDRGKFYSKTLVADIASLFQDKYPSCANYPSEEYGLVRGCLFHGLDPYQSLVHSVSSREVIVRSSRGLTEPGTLFKNLMAILRDVIICYDGTVRNVCSNSIIQFEYGAQTGPLAQSAFAAGEPVGVLAATAMSNPAYKAVLDSSPSSNNSWAMMKEILLCGVKFKNDDADRRVILYLNGCDCGRKHCGEKAAYMVKKQLQKISLKDAAVEFLIEYHTPQQTEFGSSEVHAGLVGHFHLDEFKMKDSDVTIDDVLEKCEETMHKFQKKKKSKSLCGINVSASQFCSFGQSSESRGCGMPCLKFFWKDNNGKPVEKDSHIFAHTICPVLLDTIIKGDPRVCTADIIWVSPDTTSWIRNRANSDKGELAIDVVLEKTSVKQSGDAWRIVLDICLPVMHLIDTRRSVPYSVKQIQELLGISCAFEQAIQRLSASVTMVAKGVLKEHLILLANSMTCSGNLVGFNKAGIKALSQSLNVQVPFTEATLFTPKKCFETAAEKCHVDSLASIVASCSWGKHVAVGTGTSFDLLWDNREAEVNEPDVYDFLNLLHSSSGVEKNSACLGAEIDDLDWALDYDEEALSPEHASEKPVFEDSIDLEIPDQNGWDKGTQLVSDAEDDWSNKWKNSEDSKDVWNKVLEKSGEGEHDLGTQLVSDADDGWSNRRKKSEDSKDVWNQVVEKSEERDHDMGWGKKVEPAQRSEEKDEWNQVVEKSGEGDNDLGWGNKAEPAQRSKENDMWNKVVENSGEENHDLGWGNKVEPAQVSEEKKGILDSGWGNKVDSARWSEEGGQDLGWGNRVEPAKRSEEEAGVQDSGWADKVDSAGWSEEGGQNLGWGDRIESSQRPEEEEVRGVWGKSAEESGEKLQFSGWDKKSDHCNKSSIEKESSDPWGNKKEKPQEKLSQSGWEKKAIGVRKSDSVPTALTASGKRLDLFTDDEQELLAAIEPVMQSVRKILHQSGYNEGDPLTAEDQTYITEHVFNYHPDKVVKMGAGMDYIKIDKHSAHQGRCLHLVRTDGGTEDFSYLKGLENFMKEKFPDRAEAFNAKYFKRKIDSVSTALTASGKRLDLFTDDEQELLAAIEPILQSVRKILHQSGYNEGAPLTAEDQAYIIEHVFNYHPDKVVKMGAGMDYIMINKHSAHQVRCLHLVRTDGVTEDFSYWKCMENFMKEKFPDRAESFNAKYFRRNNPQPRPGWNKERNTPEAAKSGAKKRKGWGGWGDDEASVPKPTGTENKPSGWGNVGSAPESETTEKRSSGWGNRESVQESTNSENKSSGWGNGEAEYKSGGWGNEETENKSGGWGNEETENKSGGWGNADGGSVPEATAPEVPEGAGTESQSSGWER